MKLTITGINTTTDIFRAKMLVDQYRADGYADGSRPEPRDCAVFAPKDNAQGVEAQIWGGPDHIRVRFTRRDA